jgi:hypothetical protein
MRRRVSGGQSAWSTLPFVLALLGSAATAWAQLTEADIAALRERGEREGWTFTVGENEATQRPLSELCGAVEPPDWRQHARFDPCPPRGRGLPAAWDWRGVAGFPSVRDQGNCGSCWAFSAIGAMECAMAREAGINADAFELSEQWLVSCTWAGTCGGGWPAIALDYLECGAREDLCGGGGAVLESSFPYEAWDHPCECPYTHPYCLDSWFVVGSDETVASVDQIKQAIYDHGPVSVGVHAGFPPFGAYSGGVFNACEWGVVDHAVVLVGWDDNQGPEGVWILRNSWGPTWGENGYMRIPYGCCWVGEAAAYVNFRPPDCNNNGIADRQDIIDQTSLDCNGNAIPDECEPGGNSDCNVNGFSDLCDLFRGTSADCNGNGVPDECDIAAGVAVDCDGNGVPDECELGHLYKADDGLLYGGWGPSQDDLIWLNQFQVQADANSVFEIDIVWGYVPEDTPATLALWRDPDSDGDPDDAQLLWKSSTPVPITHPTTGIFQSVPVPEVRVGDPGDVFFVGAYVSLASVTDWWWLWAGCYPAAFDNSVADGVSWAAEGANLETLSSNDLFPLSDWTDGVFMIRAKCRHSDCNANGVLDSCDVAAATSPDVNSNGLPDECESDCNSNGVPDDVDITQGTSSDCNANGVPDECETDLGVTITAQPAAVSVCEGEAATLTVGASGAGILRYQWRKSLVPIDGATQNTFTIPAVAPSDAGEYDVIVSSSCTSELYPAVTSTTATLTVEHLLIVTPPEDQSVLVGGIATFGASVAGAQSPTYQWRKDGRPIARAVLPSYTIPSAALDDAGEYDVVVGGCGSVTSEPATLTVGLARPELPSPQNGATDVPLAVRLRWQAVPGADRYDVYLGTSAVTRLAGSTEATSWSPDRLAYGTKYFWKVVAHGGSSAAEGLVWWFTTEPAPVPLPGEPSSPFPADGASGVPRSVDLLWGKASGALRYEVLLGEDPALADGRLQSNTGLCRCSLADLKPGATYYWRIIAKNEGGRTAGPIWSFATEPDTSPTDSNEPAPSEPNSPTDANSPSDTGDNAPADANTPDSGLSPPGPSAVLCPASSTALVLVTWLGLRGAHRHETRIRRRR